MKSVVLSVPDDDNLQVWISRAASCVSLRQLELSSDAMMDEQVRQAVEDRQLEVAAVRDLIASGVTRNLAGLSEAMRHQTISLLSSTLAALGEHGIKKVLLDIGVSHYAGEDVDVQFAKRVKFIRDLVVVAASQDLEICVQARFPRAYPRSPQWDLVGNIIHEVMHPSCRLALDLFPAELEADFDIRDFLRQCGYHLSVLRFNFEPLAGDIPGRSFLLSWRQALQKYLFKGLVIFRPLGSIPLELTDSLCERMDRWAEVMEVKSENE